MTVSGRRRHASETGNIRQSGGSANARGPSHTSVERETSARPCPECTQAMKLDRCTHCGFLESDPLIDKIIDHKYRIETTLGKGGMGRVYGARHVTLDGSVAIKFLLGLWAGDPIIRTRFRREALALAKLRHPSVVSLLDFGEHEGQLYMVMERIEGTLLAARMEMLPRMAAHAVHSIFDQLLDVLCAAHSHGIVHHDVKPTNVMLTDISKGVVRAKLFDFGIAKVPGDETTGISGMGNIQGTPKYMSPEQCRGSDSGPPSDIYALGVMLFEALSGVPPFAARDPAGLMAQHMFVEPPRIKEVGRRCDVCPAIERIVRDALSKRPGDRPSAAEMREHLARAFRGMAHDSVPEEKAASRRSSASLAPKDSTLGAGARARRQSGTRRAVHGVAILWTPVSVRALALRDALNNVGIPTQIWSSACLPPPSIGCAPTRVVIVLAEPDGLPRARAVRAAADQLPIEVFVVDAVDAAQMAMAVRAGATAVALSLVNDDEVCRKARGLLECEPSQYDSWRDRVGNRS